MPKMNNIDIFKAISALAMAHCYDSFPLKIKLSPGELALSLGDEFWDESQKPISENVSEYVRNRSPAGIAKPTIEWMAASGLITYEAYRDSQFIGVCLTAKGLEAIESDQDRGGNLIQAAKELAKEEFKDQARTKLKGLFSEVLSWSIEKSPTVFQAVTNYVSQ
ncbi:hypothetical protein A9Q78_07425 [Methylophaga sp. 41_12_T18]|nr:hypothetical protein A9Q78_07425 [Methylophaga sp. 41_12_T18]